MHVSSRHRDLLCLVTYIYLSNLAQAVKKNEFLLNFLTFGGHLCDTLRAEATFCTVWADVWKVASANNRPILYRACAKFVMQFASEINRQVFCQMARVSQE